MASLITYTKKSLIERIKRHIADGWPGENFSTSDREVMLYIDQALAFNLVGQVYNMAKVEGNIAVPEGYLTTYQMTSVTRDSISGNWYSTLPQPPLSLPLGYSITRVYVAELGSGESHDFLPIKVKRVPYRRLMPMPSGARYWVEGSKIWMASADGGSLGSYTVYVQMASTRTESLTDVMDLPDDAIELIFQNVVNKLIQRMQLPKDIVKDDISAGNKAS